MNSTLLCVCAVLSADPSGDTNPPVYSWTEQLATSIRGQNPTYLDDAPTTIPVSGSTSQPPAYTPPSWTPAPSMGYDPFLSYPGVLPQNGFMPLWQHRTGLFGDFLYLTPGNASVSVATPVDPAIAFTSVAAGSSLVADPDYDPGFRVGGTFALSPTSSLVATYWWYESDTSVSATFDPAATPLALRPDLVDPDSLDINGGPVPELNTSAEADYDIKFQNVDLAYRSLLASGGNYAVNYQLGLRYGRLDQDLRARYLTVLDTTFVDTNIDFDGIGPRIGIDGERMLGSQGFFLYGEGTANFLVGEFDADFRQRHVESGTVAIHGFEETRVVPVLEFEGGLGWQSARGGFRMRAGYYVGGWFNTLTTPDFISAIHHDDFSGMDDTLTFSGLALRAEVRY